MNKFIGMGRLTSEPDLKYSSNDTSMAICRYTLAIDRMKKKGQDNAETDFIRCVAFSKNGEFASQYFHKGQRVLVEGRLQIGKYTNKDGVDILTADIIIEHQEFADAPKKTTENPKNITDGFEDMEISGTTDDEIPF